MSSKCDQCKKDYDLYCIPKTLPCKNNICTTCEFTNNRYISDCKLKCEICREYHDVPVGGFPTNLELLERISEQDVQNGNNNNENENEQVKKIKQLLSKFQNIYEIAIDELNEHCTEQRRLVQLNCESKVFGLENEKIKIQVNQQSNIETQDLKKSIEKIDKQILKIQAKHDHMIEELDLYQKKNEQKFKLNNYIQLKIQKIIHMLEKMTIQEVSENTKINELNNGFDKNILLTKTKNLETKLKFFQNLIFNSRKIDFQTRIEDDEEIGFFEYDKCGTVIFINLFFVIEL
jgi:hypothetical protein